MIGSQYIVLQIQQATYRDDLPMMIDEREKKE